EDDLHILQSLSSSDHKFPQLLEQLMVDLHHHMKHEKDEDLPRLEATLPERESNKISLSFARTKQTVPTERHP
ncbi:hypothetical protein BJ875DRAFT_356582, partial [Amylocarpus encephaloides]